MRKDPYVQLDEALNELEALRTDLAAERVRREKAEAEAAGFRMAIEMAIMRILDGTEPREVAKGLCATLAAAIDAARACR